MFEIFKTILLSSGLGAAVILLLLIVKPFAAKRFSARWQYYMWLAAAVCMIIPFWKAIPGREVQKIVPNTAETQTMQPQTQTQDPSEQQTPTDVTGGIPVKHRETPLGWVKRRRVRDLITCVWIAGAGMFIILALGNYYVFLFKKKRNSMELPRNGALEEAKKELGVKRRIRVRISNDTESPMLVGTFFPIIYIPRNGIDKDAERMVFLHELTHYRHGDLIYKWLVLIVNAVHWFNPFAYLLNANISQACEVFCDMSVVRNMDEDNFAVSEKRRKEKCLRKCLRQK